MDGIVHGTLGPTKQIVRCHEQEVQRTPMLSVGKGGILNSPAHEVDCCRFCNLTLRFMCLKIGYMTVAQYQASAEAARP